MRLKLHHYFHCDNQDVLYAIHSMRTEIMDAIDDLKVTVLDYIARVDTVIAEIQGGIQKKIDDAIAADDAEEAGRLMSIKAEIEAAAAKLPPKPFEPSGNGD